MAKGELTGVQLYSVRDDMKADPMATLKALSAMGYKHVEHASYNDPSNSMDGVRKNSGRSSTISAWKMPSGHTVLNVQKHWDDTKKDFTDAWKYTVEDAAVLGQQFVISPSMSNDVRSSTRRACLNSWRSSTRAVNSARRMAR